MKKSAIIAINIGSLLIIATVSNWWNDAIMFLIAGIVPGTSYSLSPLAMLLLLALLCVGVVLIGMHHPHATTPTSQSMPKRRYNRL